MKPTVVQLVRNTSPFVGSVVYLPYSQAPATGHSHQCASCIQPRRDTLFLRPLFASPCNIHLHYLRLPVCHLGWTFLCISYVVHAVGLFWNLQFMNTIIITCFTMLLAVSSVPVFSTTFCCEIPPVRVKVSHLYKTNGKTAACMFQWLDDCIYETAGCGLFLYHEHLLSSWPEVYIMALEGGRDCMFQTVFRL